MVCASGGARRLRDRGKGVSVERLREGAAALGAHLEDRIRGTGSLSSGRPLVVSDSDAEKAARDEVAGLGGNVLRKKSDRCGTGMPITARPRRIEAHL